VAAVFTVFAVLGGAVVFGGIGAIALLPEARLPMALAAVALVGRAIWWHVRGTRHFTLQRPLVQAHKGMAGHGWLGVAYFGWILGTTLFTQLATPLVQALPAVVAALGAPFGIAAGMGLGLGRSVDPWRGALAKTRVPPAAVVQRYAGGGASATLRVLAIASAAIAAVAGIVDALQ